MGRNPRAGPVDGEAIRNVDPWLADRIAEAVSQYADMLLPEELERMAQQMLEVFAKDECCAKLLRKARPVESESTQPPSNVLGRVVDAADISALRWEEIEPDWWILELGNWTFEIVLVLDAALFGSREGDHLHTVVDLGAAAPVRAFLARNTRAGGAPEESN